MTRISAVIITRNEAHNIARCLASLKQVADELIVVDAHSMDGTPEIAKEHGALVTARAWTNFSDQKNVANALASYPYILSLDADEALSPELASDILRHKAAGLSGAYRLKRLTNYCGKWVRHGGWYPDAKVRLFAAEGALWKGDHVHETLSLPPGTAITELRGDLLHYSYPTVKSHVDRIERYSTLHAQGLHADGRTGGMLKQWLSPVAKFISGYVLQLGFLDGWAGWKIATLSAEAVYLKYRKLQELELADEEP